MFSVNTLGLRFSLFKQRSIRLLTYIEKSIDKTKCTEKGKWKCPHFSRNYAMMISITDITLFIRLFNKSTLYVRSWNSVAFSYQFLLINQEHAIFRWFCEIQVARKKIQQLKPLPAVFPGSNFGTGSELASHCNSLSFAVHVESSRRLYGYVFFNPVTTACQVCKTNKSCLNFTLR